MEYCLNTVLFCFVLICLREGNSRESLHTNWHSQTLRQKFFSPVPSPSIVRIIINHTNGFSTHLLSSGHLQLTTRPTYFIYDISYNSILELMTLLNDEAVEVTSKQQNWVSSCSPLGFQLREALDLAQHSLKKTYDLVCRVLVVTS